MAIVKKKKSRQSKPKEPPPTSLVLDLHAPGMTLLHRAGLGGLAATLRAMERRHKRGLLSDNDLPSGPDLGDGYPWRIEPTRITLTWNEPTAAGEYFKRLFAFAFGIKDKLIDLPGTYRNELSRAVRAGLQKGIETTFLTHAPTAGSRAGVNTTFLEIESVPFQIRHSVFTSYRHQGWYWLERAENEEITDPKTGKTKKQKTGIIKKTCSALEFVDESDAFFAGRFSVDKKIFPGAVSRHSGLGDSTTISQDERSLLCLYFAMVGCLSFQGPLKHVRDKRTKKLVWKPTGILVVPEISDVSAFAQIRPRMTPMSVRACHITGASDAALQAMVRLKLKRLMRRHAFDSICSIHLAPTDWATDQLSRIESVDVPVESRADDRWLKQFEVALSHLPPYVRSKEVSHSTGRGKIEVTTKSTEWFWVDSVVRPLIADNLAKGKRWWYDGFITLTSNRTQRDKLQYEKKGLREMVHNSDLLDDEEVNFILAMHRAIYMARGKIYQDTMGKAAAKAKRVADDATKNRWNRFMENLRRKLVNAKTAIQVQNAITGVLGQTGTVKELRDAEAMRRIKTVIFGDDWQRVRNLGAYALASYKRPDDKVALPDDPQDTSEPDEEGLELSNHEEQSQ